MAINWGILRSPGPVDIGANFERGYKMGREIVGQAHERNALAAYAANPGDPQARAALYRVNPGLAAKLELVDMKRSDWEREGEARGALADFMTGPNGLPQPHGVTGTVPNALTGQVPNDGDYYPDGTAISAPGVREGGEPRIAAPAMTGAPEMNQQRDPLAPLPDDDEIVVTGQRPEAPPDDGLIRRPPMSEDWQRYVRADPKGAMEYLIDRADLGEKQAKALAGQMEVIASYARNAVDQPSYEAALQAAQGQGFDTSHLPREFDPETVANIQDQAMSAKEYIKTKWDIEDDKIDNAEVERRNRAREAISRRGQDLTDARGRRGQDIGSRDRRRGQDKASEDRRRGQDKRGQGRGGGSTRTLPRVKSVAEARALPPGTMFIDPDGNVRRR